MRILIVDYEFPEYDASSGGLRLEQIIRILRKAGHEVTFLSIDYFLHPECSRQIPRYKTNLEELGVICYQSWTDDLPPEFSREITHGYDVAIICRYYMFNRYSQSIRNITCCKNLILDTVDAHYVRERRQSEITGKDNKWQATKHLEEIAVSMADRIWTVTNEDANAFTHNEICVVPNIYPKTGNVASFENRDGIVFVGNYKHEPNLDGVDWFVKAMLPVFNRLFPQELFYAGGAYSKGSIDTYKDKGYSYFQWQSDLMAFLNRRKVGVVPLRYGSGLKGKIGSYMAAGLPVVTTSIGAEGMRQGVIVEDDPERFIYAVAALLRSKALWERYSNKSLAIVDEYSPSKMESVVLSAIF
jgi:O-antigen biosynthesis protein